MSKKQLTKEEWQDFVKGNCIDSYSLAVCLAIILLWEKPNKDTYEVLKGLNLSGAQAEMAIEFTKENDLAVSNLQGNPLTKERENFILPPTQDINSGE